MIRRCEFERTLAAVRRTGVAGDIELMLRPSGGGRPRQLDVGVFLAGLIATVQDNRALTLVNLHAALTTEIPRSLAVGIGTHYRRKGEECSRPITIRQVRYLLEAIERRLAHTDGRAPDLGEADRTIRAAALQRILDRIIASSLPAELPVPSTMALDGTAIDSWARSRFGRKGRSAVAAEIDLDTTETEATAGTQKKKKATAGTRKKRFTASTPKGSANVDRTSFDPDAGRGHRTRTWDNKTTFCFGYELFAMVAVPLVGAAPDLFPKLTHAISLRPSGTDVVEPALGMLDAFASRGTVVTELLNDRAWSYKTPDRWADVLREREIEQVLDLHQNDRGVLDFEGIRMIDGTPHCPATPDELTVITRPAVLSVAPLRANADALEIAHHEKALAEHADFAARIAERRRYAFRLVENASPSAKDKGKTRWECPAQAGKMRCTNCPMSQFLDPATTPEIEDPPELSTAPKCCTQRTVTIPGAARGKLAQRYYWGSPEWIEAFARRTHVEGYFGNLKNTSSGNVKRGWCKVVGIVKTSILLACAVAATNISLFRTWAERTGDISDALCQPDPPNHGYEELEPETTATPATGPPFAA